MTDDTTRAAAPKAARKRMARDPLDWVEPAAPAEAAPEADAPATTDTAAPLPQAASDVAETAEIAVAEPQDDGIRAEPESQPLKKTATRRASSKAAKAETGAGQTTEETALTQAGPGIQTPRNPAMSSQPEKSASWDSISTFDALGVLSNPIMIADKNMVIQFVNEAAYKMFETIEADIRRDLPHFEARRVVGKTIDVFHKNPVYQRRILENMVVPHDGKFSIGGKDLAFKATPIFSADGELTCIYVEWQDRTAAVAQKQQVELLINSISEMADKHENGIISHYIDLEGFIPEMRVIAEGVNAMVSGHISTKKKILACVGEFAKGNFDAPIEKFSGERFFINDAIEEIRTALRSVSEEVQRFCSGLETGDLAVQMNTSRFQGEYRTIASTMDRALVALNATIASASKQIQQVAITVDQMSQSSQSLATNSQIQSSSVDEVSASAEQTNIQVKANAASADSAAQLVAGASMVASEGTSKIAEMVQSMEGIRASSQDIAKIIKVIDEIAFQTNLLALNAAVEAARAGQHGRGFAVVAQEVRNLAGRSAKAARETSDLIEDASTRVQAGVRIADEARNAFSRIADDISQVQTLVRDIAVSSEEQARGVAQINGAIGEIAKSALATSQQADELAASAAEMQSASEMMRKDFDRFTLRAVEAARESMAGLEDLTPEMIAQFRQMLAMNGGAGLPAKALNGSGHARPSRGNADRDERGFGAF